MDAELDLVKHAAQFDWVYKWGVLKPEIHYRLVIDIYDHCAKANVRPEYVVQPLSAFCKATEIDFVTRHRALINEGKAGLAYVGVNDCVTRLQAMCGAFLRNFINAEVRTAQQVIESIKAGTITSPSVMAIPNFFIMKEHGSDVAKWDAGRLQDLLYRRYFARQMTVITIENMKSLTVQYGPGVAQHIQDNFIIVEG